MWEGDGAHSRTGDLVPLWHVHVGAGRCGAVAKLESGCRRTRQPMCSPFSLPEPPVTSARHASLGSHFIANWGRARQSEFARGWKDSHS